MSLVVKFTAIRSNVRVAPGPETYAALHDYTQTWCANLITEVSEYPPEPEPAPHTDKYIRTFRLLRNWRLKDQSTGAGIQYAITNPVQDRWGRYYSGYVHGPSGQASFHAEHGWKNIREYQNRPDFQAGAQAIIERGAGGII